MNEIININYDNSDRPTVSGRELHEALEVNTRYNDWFKRMCDYGFTENSDFIAITQKRVTAQGNETTFTDHQLTINTAKELCMIQRTEKGKQCRQYFISIENAWNSPEAVMSRALKIADRKLLEAQDHVRTLEMQIEADKPKTIFADAVSVSKTSILIGELAKLLKQNGIEIGQNRLFAWLREKGYLISRKGTDYNMPTQKSMELKLFEIKENSITHSDGHTSITKTPKVTGKGQIYFINIFMKGA